MSSSEISSVLFSLNTDDQVIQTSTVKVEVPDTYDGEVPIRNGLYSPRMGPLTSKLKCETCHLGRDLCPGHLGHIVLAMPIQDPIMRDESIRWLSSICASCYAMMYKKAAKCPVCKAVQPKYTKNKEDKFSIITTNQAGESKVIEPEAIRQIFDKIPESYVAERFRAIHPRHLIRKVFPIPPNMLRPGVRPGTPSTMMPAMQSALAQIVSANNKILDEPAKRQQFQHKIYAFINGDPNSATAKAKGFRNRLGGGTSIQSPGILRLMKSKKGSIRQQQLGRFVVGIGRSIITADCRLHVDEISIPVDMAKGFCIIETVHEFNIKRLMPYFLNGKNKYPGATILIKGTRIYSIAHSKGLMMEIGDKLYRDLDDGDYIWANRAPTLVKSGIGLHRVVIDKGSRVVRINVAVCPLYGADFDGDEMNVWPSKYAATLAEGLVLSRISTNFINPKTSSPAMGQIQDSITGLFNLTRSKTVLDKNHLVQLFAGTDIDLPFIADKKYTGRDVISFVLEKYPIDYVSKTKFNDPICNAYTGILEDEKQVIIRAGKMISGVLDKKTLAENNRNSIYGSIAAKYGAEVAIWILYQMQKISLNFGRYMGFTVSLADMMLDRKTFAEIRHIVCETTAASEVISRKMFNGQIVPQINKSIQETYELMQLAELKVDDSTIVRTIMNNLIDTKNNSLFEMVATGAKGKIENFINMLGCLGQKAIDGERLPENLAFGRTLPYYHRSSTDPVARGFVKNSYITGLDLIEFWSVAQASRDELVYKSLGTSIPGTFQRMNNIALQGSIVDNWFHVKSGSKILQMLYGDDGCDPRKVESITFKGIENDIKSVIQAKCGSVQGTEEYQKLLTEYRDWFVDFKITDDKRNFISDPDPKSALMSINVGWIIHNTKKPPGYKPDAKVGFTDKWRIIKGCLDSLVYVFSNHMRAKRGDIVGKHLYSAVKLVKFSILWELSPVVAADFDIGYLEAIRETILLKYKMSLVSYGSSMGIIAVQSICEPLVQYFLDAHHRSVSGGSSKDSVNQFKEILEAKNPDLEIHKKMFIVCTDPEKLAREIEHLPFSKFCVEYQMMYELPNELMCPKFKSDSKWMLEFARVLEAPKDITPWNFRITVDKYEMVYKSITLAGIITKLNENFPDTYIMYTPEASEQMIIRVYLRRAMLTSMERASDVERYINDIMSSTVQGIHGIRKATVRPIMRTVRLPDGKFGQQKFMIVETEGSNVLEIMSRDDVNQRETIISSVGETYNVLGIAAAKSRIASELNVVIGHDPKELNPRHAMMYANIMTSTGRLTSVVSAGLRHREPTNLLLRMASMAPLQAITEGVTYGIKSKVEGLIPSLMVGTTPHTGSRFNDIYFDEEFIKKNFKSMREYIKSI